MRVSQPFFQGLFFVLFFSGISALAQIDLGIRNVNGVVIREKGGLPAGLRVRVEQLRGGMPISDAQLAYDGSFQFNATEIPPGDYQIKVINWRNEVIHSEHVSIRGSAEPLQIRLPPRERSDPVAGTVSVNELRAPAKARQLFAKAAAAAKSGDRQAAIRRLKKAIKIYPEFESAHLSLGARLMESGDYRGALEQFDSVLHINPESAFGHSNRGVALHALGRYGEAVEAARRALAIGPASEKSHFVLALALWANRQAEEETLNSLRIAGSSIPRARIMAAGLLAEKGLFAEALVEIQKYLQSEDVLHRQMAEQWQADWTSRLAKN